VSDTAGVLWFGLLGELRAERHDRPLDLGPRLQRHLLAILLVEAGRVVAVDRLIDLLWGETPPGAAIASLQAYVSQLRRILEPDRPARAPAQLLVTQEPGYVLRVDADQVDGTRFLGLAARGRELLDAGRAHEAANNLDLALAQWRGPALVEFHTEGWAVATAARLTEARETALEDRVDAWLAQGRHAQAVSDIEALVRASPLRERRWAQLILATYRSGRQADALRAYQRGRTVLADELGIEPGPELRRLESAVLAQDPRLEFVLEKGPPVALAPLGPAAEPDADRPLSVHRAQLDRLKAGIDSAVSGRGGMVVLVGEPGVGKTTLAEQAAGLAEAAGLAVLWCRCLDPGSAPVFWPWLQLLSLMPPGPAGEEARLRLEGQAEAAEAGRAATFRAYQSVLAALRSTAETRPLFLAVDDLHAADKPSLDLLGLLAGDLDRLPVVVCATWRDTEPSPAVDQVVGDLVRNRAVERLVVPPLRPDEVGQLTRRNHGREPDPAVTTALFERTGGNFFYLVELLRLLGSEHGHRQLTAADVTGVDVPDNVRDVVLRRAARLPDNSRTILTVAAVAGADPDFDVLERTAQLDSEQLLLALEPALAAGLLAEVASGWGYRFRHPLIQESLYAGVGRVERARLHARVAAAMEAWPQGDSGRRLAELAHHYMAAGPLGDTAKAVAYSWRAAAAAIQVGAWAEAIRLLEAALAVLAAGGVEATAIRCDMLVELARARRGAGLGQEAHDTLIEAIEYADGLGDQERHLTAALAFGSIWRWGSREWAGTDRRLVGHLERQLGRLGQGDDPRRVRILSSLAQELYFDDAAPTCWRYAQEAMQMARRLEDPDSISVAVSAYFWAADANDLVSERRAAIGGLLGTPELLDTEAEAVVRYELLIERLRHVQLGLFDAEFPRCWALATDLLHSVELERQLHVLRAGRIALSGDIDGALAEAEKSFQLMAGDSPRWLPTSRFVLETALWCGTNTLADHAEMLEKRASNPEHVSIPHLAAPAAALAYAERGDIERARQLTRQWFAPPPRIWSRRQALAHWAQVAVLTGEPDPQWCYEQLLPRAGELALVSGAAQCGGAVDSILAGLALRLGRRQEALERALAGLALEQQAGPRHWAVRTSKLIDSLRA
jgi:DNA-binding SARP family transcriptional activator